MNVKLVALTQPALEDTSRGNPGTPEELLVYIARVSSPHNQANNETGERLLRRCMRKGHWSVFEHAGMTVEIETSMAIGEQLLRHRSFTFQKFSGRYSVIDLGFEPARARRQDTKNRQSSHDDLPEDAQEQWQRVKASVEETCQRAYEFCLESGVAKEVARFLLPASTRTRLYMTGNVRSWIHYLQARDAEGVQAEHREVASAIRAIFDRCFPITAAAMRDEP